MGAGNAGLSASSSPEFSPSSSSSLRLSRFCSDATRSEPDGSSFLVGAPDKRGLSSSSQSLSSPADESSKSESTSSLIEASFSLSLPAVTSSVASDACDVTFSSVACSLTAVTLQYACSPRFFFWFLARQYMSIVNNQLRFGAISRI